MLQKQAKCLKNTIKKKMFFFEMHLKNALRNIFDDERIVTANYINSYSYFYLSSLILFLI